MLNQVCTSAKYHAVRYKFGVRVPKSVKEAFELDQANGDTQWSDAIKLEILQLHEYQTFKDGGKNKPIPRGYQKIRCHWVFDVKQSGKRKARFVAGGNLTDPPRESVYSGVVPYKVCALLPSCLS